MLERFEKKKRRHDRIRSKVSGAADIPRLAVSASGRHVIAQIIDDVNGRTLAYASDKNKDFKDGKTKTENATKVGEMIALAAKKRKINRVVFDRGGRLYHGRVKALAESARKNGLEF